MIHAPQRPVLVMVPWLATLWSLAVLSGRSEQLNLSSPSSRSCAEKVTVAGPSSSPRHHPATRRDSYDQTQGGGPGPGPRYPATGYSESGTHSLPFTFHNNYNDVTLYQVPH